LTKRRKVMVVVGTRPEGIKMAPVVAALRARPSDFEVCLVSTGQHREMLAQVLDAFDLAPDEDLALMRPDQSLFDLTSLALLATGSAMRRWRPDLVLVQGDTTTAFAAALAATYERVPIGHVEAGLRTGNPALPFPEEINRKLIDHLAEICFAPTETAARALEREGIAAERIHLTGNTVVDALQQVRPRLRARRPEIPGFDLEAEPDTRLILVTGHRRESFGETFEGICLAIRDVVQRHPDVRVVYPVHLNPNVAAPVRRILGQEERVHLLAPQGYLDFLALLERAYLVLTDSGGVQEEAPAFGKPVLVMRDVTERPEGVACGVACVVGTSRQSIGAALSDLLEQRTQYERMSRALSPYGDGRAAERIAEIVAVS